MQIRIQATNLNLTDTISGYVEKRLSALEKLIDSDDTSAICNVEVEKTTEHHRSGDIFRAEANVHIAGHTFRAEAEREKLFDAIDEVKQQMTKELRRHKEKKIKDTRRGGAELKDRIHGEK